MEEIETSCLIGLPYACVGTPAGFLVRANDIYRAGLRHVFTKGQSFVDV